MTTRRNNTICSNCGYPNSQGAKFCIKCGMRLSKINENNMDKRAKKNISIKTVQSLHYRILLIIIFSIIAAAICIYLFLIPSPAEKLVETDGHGRTYVSFVYDDGITSYDHYANDDSIGKDSSILQPDTGYNLTAFTINGEAFQSVFIYPNDDANRNTYKKQRSYSSTDVEQFIGRNNVNKLHGTMHPGEGKYPHGEDITAERYSFKLSGRDSIIVNVREYVVDHEAEDDKGKYIYYKIYLTNIHENPNGSWLLKASRLKHTDSSLIRRTTATLILFPQTVH
ncbi:zinc ribbon domain-containing protein [Lactobacillus rhamnosus]|uniref:Zinc ribbon domain-containing protein n=1 Tax=Lacticaseibacillus rhamnosus TaxID=47715 RepID=A0A7Y7UKA3_LACRH|nr:zinc ribbon domain-containing protein [Lacticaseibacillus rhamnosus]NVO89108.1 zinc ribbon domain-containing protein [Lacticaseibacillus rhamnosus]